MVQQNVNGYVLSHELSGIRCAIFALFPKRTETVVRAANFRLKEKSSFPENFSIGEISWEGVERKKKKIITHSSSGQPAANFFRRTSQARKCCSDPCFPTSQLSPSIDQGLARAEKKQCNSLDWYFVEILHWKSNYLGHFRQGYRQFAWTKYEKGISFSCIIACGEAKSERNVPKFCHGQVSSISRVCKFTDRKNVVFWGLQDVCKRPQQTHFFSLSEIYHCCCLLVRPQTCFFSSKELESQASSSVYIEDRSVEFYRFLKIHFYLFTLLN